MISLCSGCLRYYQFECDKPYDEKAETRECDHFRFYPTKHFKHRDELLTFIGESLPSKTK